jgi:hypothetical protein
MIGWKANTVNNIFPGCVMYSSLSPTPMSVRFLAFSHFTLASSQSAYAASHITKSSSPTLFEAKSLPRYNLLRSRYNLLRSQSTPFCDPYRRQVSVWFLGVVHVSKHRDFWPPSPATKTTDLDLPISQQLVRLLAEPLQSIHAAADRLYVKIQAAIGLFELECL